MFFIMSQITMTATTAPLTVVWSSASFITMIVRLGPTSLGIAPSSQHDVVLAPLLILWDALRG